MNYLEAIDFLNELTVMYPPTKRQKTWHVGNIPMAEFAVLEPKIRAAMRSYNAVQRTNKRHNGYFTRLRVIFNGPREVVPGQHSKPMHTRRSKALYACVYRGSGFIYAR